MLLVSGLFYHPVVSDSATLWTAAHQASLSFRLNLKPPQKSVEDPHTDMTVKPMQPS